jgi:hypothetical protein
VKHLFMLMALSVGQTDLSESRRVLSVDVRTESGQSRGYGSGTVIATRGDRALVLTARHLFRPTDTKREIVDYDGQHYPARVLGVSESCDLALTETTTPRAIRSRLVARGLDAARSHVITFAQHPADVVQIAGYGEGKHQLAAQTGRKLRGPLTLQTRNRTLQDCYLYAVEPRDGDSGAGAFSAAGFAGVVTHRSDSNEREGVIVGPTGVKKFLEAQCIGGWCTAGLSIDGPGVSIRSGRLAQVFGGGGNGQFFERYRRGPFNWESYTRRGGSGFGGGFATTYGGVWGGGSGSFSSFATPAYEAQPVISYDSVISPAYAPIYAQSIPLVRPTLPVQVVAPPLVDTLTGRVAVLESRLAVLERIVGQP